MVFVYLMMSTNALDELGGKRLVVFGAGYVGGHVASLAAAAGARVTALTRNEEKARALRAGGVDTVVADLAASDWHARIAGDVDYVLDSVGSGGSGLAGYEHSYLKGMRSVVAWLGGRQAKRVVYTSSTSVYPQGGGVRVEEGAEVDEAGERPRVLVETERYLRALPAANGATCVLRLAGIYGPGRHHLIEQVRSGDVAGEPANRLNLIHRDDLIAAVWATFFDDAARGEIFNVADDEPTAKGEVAAWLAGRLGVAVPRFTGMPAGGRRAVTPDRVIVNAKLKARLGWRPRYPSFREGYAAILGA